MPISATPATGEGSCLCGAVRFTVTGGLGAPNACHCTACRKQTGHYLASTEVAKSAVTVSGEVRWFASSPKVRRGFCPGCGSTLFWEPVFRDWTAIAMGAFDGPTGVHLTHHIFVADKGDYYAITDGLPQNAQ
jgi:hypothetical protein